MSTIIPMHFGGIICLHMERLIIYCILVIIYLLYLPYKWSLACDVFTGDMIGWNENEEMKSGETRKCKCK
jgi:hypothetical protein